MMDGILNWAGNILFFMVMMTVVENLLPGKKYSRYVRLPAGMVLILLVLKPVTEGFHLEEKIARSLESFTFQQDAKDLSWEILGVEKERLSRIMDNYQQAVEADVSAMAEEMGFGAVEAHVAMDRDQESQGLGTVTGIRLEVRREGEEEETDGRAVQAVNPVEPVRVTLREETGEEQSPAEEERGAQKRGRGQEEEAVGMAESTEAERADREMETPEDREAKAVDELRRKVESYYGLETGEVEITYKRD